MLVAFIAGSPFFQPVPKLQPQFPWQQALVERAPKIKLKPGQACAIPLLNVLPRGHGQDRGMVKHVAPPPVSTAEIVQPPAPSCDDVK